jgi:hypothetical protein
MEAQRSQNRQMIPKIIAPQNRKLKSSLLGLKITGIIQMPKVRFITFVVIISTFLASNSETNKSKSNHLDQQSPSQQNHKQQSPVNHKHKLENSTEVRIAKQQKLGSPQLASTSAQIPKIELPYISPLRRPTDNYSRPSSRQGSTRTELFACKFPDYAIGEYYGYRITVSIHVLLRYVYLRFRKRQTTNLQTCRTP